MSPIRSLLASTGSFLSILSIVSCVTPQEERQIKTDIARLQAQVVEMQNAVQDSGSSLKSSSLRAANTNTKIEQMSIEIQRLKGDLDTLRVGVVTGQLPGHGEDDGPSMATKLLSVIERLEELEQNQKTLLEVIEKANKKKIKSSKSNRKASTSIKGLRRAFKEKRYRHVKEDAPNVIRKYKKGSKNRHESQFLFAESLYKLGDIKSAALEFDEYLKSKPTSELAHANLRLGDCFRHLGDSATAKIYYDELVSRYAKSKEAQTAKERLEKLRI